MIRVGKLVATHGLNGTLILSHIIADNSWLKKGDCIMVELQKGSLIPYFAAQIKANNAEEYLVNLEDVTTQNEAKRLVGKSVYVDADKLEKYAASMPLLWIGFAVKDKHYGELGTMQDIMQTGAQWVGKINYKENEALIPLVADMLLKIDLKNKIIFTNLPEGLLEIYIQ